MKGNGKKDKCGWGRLFRNEREMVEAVENNKIKGRRLLLANK